MASEQDQEHQQETAEEPNDPDHGRQHFWLAEQPIQPKYRNTENGEYRHGDNHDERDERHQQKAKRYAADRHPSDPSNESLDDQP